jgi:RNA-dependent RNA polymerase
MITRNPCLHPGDVRVMTGVDRPQLRHLTNVVVFSSKGVRPACNMMAGGDLDGDVYFVCWDEELMEKHLMPSMVLPPAKYEKPKIIHEKPDGDTLADYFVFYLERDVLGKISNLHLALCD